MTKDSSSFYWSSSLPLSLALSPTVAALFFLHERERARARMAMLSERHCFRKKKQTHGLLVPLLSIDIICQYMWWQMGICQCLEWILILAFANCGKLRRHQIPTLNPM